MSERSEYAPGEFCWVDLATSDVEAAKAFYADLLGAGTEAAPGDPEQIGHYGFLMRDGKRVAGYGDAMGPDQPPAWSSYIAVGDADETAGKVNAAGGTVVMEPFDLPGDTGRMAVCQDAEGAFFSIYQSRGNVGAQLVNEPGSWTWNNLVTRDLDKAKDFYGRVFGWTAEAAPEAPPDTPYLMWQVEGQRWDEGLGGVSTADSDLPAEVPPHWQVYFAVPSADGAVEKTTSAGGACLFGPQRIPVGTMAILVDPQGAPFAIIEPDYPEER